MSLQNAGQPRTDTKNQAASTGVHLSRRRAIGAAFALAATACLWPSPSPAYDRELPMRFDLRAEGPADVCRPHCRKLIAASGSITADTPRDFAYFAQTHDLTGGLVVLDSDGGSVHGAIALGQEIRRLKLDTTVGTLVALDSDATRAALSPRADCQSMCAFVLLAGVRRFVPEGARVMVHQIWLGDRRDDPMAANYSAEDLALVQRDIGRLARYTMEMGASIELLDLALRIPPWEPMHVLSTSELRSARVETAPAANRPVDAVAASAVPAQAARVGPPATQGEVPGRAAISERQWTVIDRAGSAALARSHPLTVEGEEIGSFDLILSCGSAAGSYELSYIEHRHAAARSPLPAAVRSVDVSVHDTLAKLTVVSSGRRNSDELVTFATGAVPAAMIDLFAAAGTQSMMIETASAGGETAIRLGNTGARQNLPYLARICAGSQARRADLALPKTGARAARP
jgi:hypothetical protein